RTEQIFPGRGFFRGLSDKLTKAKAICLKHRRFSSSSSSASAAAGGSNLRKCVALLDVHREEAIEDSIGFINHSSSSLPRSKSISV
ncbi:hypothetical protein LINPERPRIM_LOCUS7044, partial [Linum perenne]